jgi:two-component system response regulator
LKTDGNKNGDRTDILLVDDNPADTVLVLNALQKANILNRVHVLSDGREILEFLFRKGRYHDSPSLSAETLILLSLKLKGVSGVDVLRKIKSDERSRNFPVILLTSSQEDCGVMDSYKLGANACIVHPIDLHKFIEAVAELRLGWLLVSPDDHEKGA